MRGILAKRTAGAPLSQEEHQQRVDAAKASAAKRRRTIGDYEREARAIPMLGEGEERDLLARWKDKRETAARDRVVEAHLRLAVSGARKLSGYGLPLEDMVAAGNMGLLQAAEKFDASKGARFSTFALPYIAGSQKRFVQDNASIVRMGTDRDQKRLFFSLRGDMKGLLGGQSIDDERAKEIAERRGVKASAVHAMAAHLAGRDASLNMRSGEDDDGEEWLNRLSDGVHAEDALVSKETNRTRRASAARAIAGLSERERRVLVARHLRQPPATLHEIGRALGISAERVRQIENQAMRRVQAKVAADPRLAKRTPGAPLSDKELRQRREAARSRSATGGGALAGALAASFAVRPLAERAARRAVAADPDANVRALDLAQRRREGRLDRVDATVEARAKNARRPFTQTVAQDEAKRRPRPGPVARRVRDLRNLVATADGRIGRLHARMQEVDAAFRSGKTPRPGLSEGEASRAASDLRTRAADAKGEIDELVAARPKRTVQREGTVVVRRRAQWLRDNRPVNAIPGHVHGRDAHTVTLPSDLGRSRMKQLRGALAERAKEQATQAKARVNARWHTAAPGLKDAFQARATRTIAGRLRGKWRIPALLGGAAVGAAIGYGANRLSKGAVDDAAAQARMPGSLAQSEAGNYRKGHVALHGMRIAIETPRGAVRRKLNQDGTLRWSCRMPAHYGYVKGTRGADGDHVDVYLGPDAEDPDCPVFVIDQHKLDGAFDEHKAVLGARTKDAALAIYDGGFSDGSGPRRRRGVTTMSAQEFSAKAVTGAMLQPLAKNTPPDDGGLGGSDMTTPLPGQSESALATRLAALFRSWLESPAQVGNREDIAQALDPLWGVLRSGADAATPPPPPEDSLYGTPENRTLAISFDARSPEVERRLRDYALGRIRAITEESRETIRRVLIDAAQQGLPVDEQARQIREAIGLSPGQQGWVTSYRRGLQALDPRVLQRALRDRRHDSPIQRAIDTDTPLASEDIERYVASYHRRALAYRAISIARTEALRGANTGMVEGARVMLQDNPDVTVEKVWIATADDRTRDAHRELDGKKVIGLDQPFEINGQQIRWPHDDQAPAALTVNCRCTLGLRLIPKPGYGRLIAEAA